MAKAFLARFDGVCHVCNGPIRKGDPIIWPRHGVNVGKKGHLACVRGTDPEPEPEPVTEPVTEPEPEPEPVTEPEPEPEPVTEPITEPATRKSTPSNGSGAVNALQGLADALAPLIESQIAVKVDETRVREIIAETPSVDTDAIKTLIDSAVANLGVRTVNLIDTSNTVIAKIENAHCMAEDALYLSMKRIHQYYYGPAGSGKSTLAQQVAKALGLEFSYISLNYGTLDYKLLGTITATGEYLRTPFRDRVEHGGVFCIDECDNAHASILTTLNAILENGHAAFPDGIINVHPDFILIATGNTNGRGATRNHKERREFDAAFANRFAYLEITYDEKLESNIALAINPQATTWVQWVQRVRAFAKANHPQLLVTPRTSIAGAKMISDSGWSVEKIAHVTLWKGLEQSQIDTILNACPYPTMGVN